MILLKVKLPLWNHKESKWAGSEVNEYCWNDNGVLVNMTFNTQVGPVKDLERLKALFEINMQGEILEMVEG